MSQGDYTGGNTMKVCVLTAIQVSGEEVPPGSFIDIPETDLPGLMRKVAYIKDGGLRVPLYVASLEALIVGLTSDDLHLQKQLLIRHCQAFDRRSIDNRWKEWDKKVAALENKGMERKEAELEAARELNLLAFLNDRHPQDEHRETQ